MVMNDIVINNSNVWITRNKAVKNRLFLQKKVMERPRFYKMFKFWNWRIYITHNMRLRNREKRDYTRDIFNTKCFRKHCYERSGHKCEICGKEITYQEAQLHHILPFHKFQQFAMDERNMQIVQFLPQWYSHRPFQGNTADGRKSKRVWYSVKRLL